MQLKDQFIFDKLMSGREQEEKECSCMWMSESFPKYDLGGSREGRLPGLMMGGPTGSPAPVLSS